MAGQYTEEDKKAFRLKDQLNAKQSALKAASILYEGAFESVTMKGVLEEADKALAWLSNGQEWPGVKDSCGLSEQSTAVSDISCPKPTLDQQKALDKVLAETGWNAAQVYARFSKFPVMSNVDVCIQKIKE